MNNVRMTNQVKIQCLDLSIEECQQMENIYKMGIPEFQSLTLLYNMERETAHRQQRLKRFPKCLSQWQPEGGPLDPHLQPLLDSIHSGPRPTAIAFTQCLTESKQHSRESFYVSRQHSAKRPSVVSFRHPSTGKLKFGEVDKIYQHSYALKSHCLRKPGRVKRWGSADFLQINTI